jgi:serine protease AprX
LSGENADFNDAAMNKDGSYVLSTPLRLDASESFTGKGVTIAFLDSGFYPHADLTEPRNRILAYQNMNATDGEVASLFQPDVASWHGMMTSVVAAGNGGLSNGFYRGIAPEADVVLVKLARTGRITEQNIQDGLEWILSNRTKFNIKIVNISAGGDFEQSYLHDSLSQTVEEAVAQGLTIVCAVGNAGHLPTHPVFPPASSPSAIRLGGSTIKTLSIAHGAECIVQVMVRQSTVFKSPKSLRHQSGFPRRFCLIRPPRIKQRFWKF